MFTEGVTAIRVGDMKLILGAPGDGRILAWPDLLPTGHSAVPFGRSGGVTRRDVNGDSCLAGILIARKDMSEKCNPGCLFNLTNDPAESVNVYAQHPGIVASLAGKLKVAGDAAPPPSSYWGDDNAGGLAEICAAQVKTGFLEPVTLR